MTVTRGELMPGGRRDGDGAGAEDGGGGGVDGLHDGRGCNFEVVYRDDAGVACCAGRGHGDDSGGVGDLADGEGCGEGREGGWFATGGSAAGGPSRTTGRIRDGSVGDDDRLSTRAFRSMHEGG